MTPEKTIVRTPLQNRVPSCIPAPLRASKLQCCPTAANRSTPGAPGIVAVPGVGSMSNILHWLSALQHSTHRNVRAPATYHCNKIGIQCWCRQALTLPPDHNWRPLRTDGLWGRSFVLPIANGGHFDGCQDLGRSVNCLDLAGCAEHSNAARSGRGCLVEAAAAAKKVPTCAFDCRVQCSCIVEAAAGVKLAALWMRCPMSPALPTREQEVASEHAQPPALSGHVHKPDNRHRCVTCAQPK
jgi:hypothetical protein